MNEWKPTALVMLVVVFRFSAVLTWIGGFISFMDEMNAGKVQLCGFIGWSSFIAGWMLLALAELIEFAIAVHKDIRAQRLLFERMITTREGDL